MDSQTVYNLLAALDIGALFCFGAVLVFALRGRVNWN